MRARYPDTEGHIERDGANIGYEIYENKGPTILLLPTWTIIHSRFWKMQIPYLARHYRVITYDGPGNGSSDRVIDPARYTFDAYAQDALAVLDATGTERAYVAGLSLGAAYAAWLGALAPDRVDGMVMFGPAIQVTPPLPERASIADNFDKPYADDVAGWGKYNHSYWQDHYDDFVDFFMNQCLSEPHSTKQIEDAVGWASETGPEVIGAEAMAPHPEVDWIETLSALQCPVLVIHGTHDLVAPVERGKRTAKLTNGQFLSLVGSGHLPVARDPVRVNLAIRSFVERVNV